MPSGSIESHASIFPDMETFVRQRYPSASVIPLHKKLLFEPLALTGRFSVTFDVGAIDRVDFLTGRNAIDAISSSGKFAFDGQSRSHLQEIRDTLSDDTHYALIEFGIPRSEFNRIEYEQRCALFGHPRRFPYPVDVVISRILLSNSAALWFEADRESATYAT